MKTDMAIIKALRHQLHRCPELSMKEYQTKNILMDFIRTNTTCEIIDFGSWFLGIAGKEKAGKPIAFRSEMDALPIPETIPLPYASNNMGVSHKCGHDGHAACLCGLARELTERPAARPVYFVFQPGEEIGAGGEACSEYLKKIGISEVYAFHNLPGYPLGSIVLKKGLAQPASEGLRLHFTGRCAHASEPEAGINPSEVIAKTVLFIKTVSDEAHKGMAFCTLTGIKAGTGAFGISAGDGELSLTLRAENEDEMKKMEERIVSYAEKESLAKGVTCSHDIHDYFPETRNDPECIERVRSAAVRSGREIVEMKALWRASEDFGYYTKRMPGAIFYIGAGKEAPPLHTPEYDFPDEIIENAIDMMYTLAE